MTQEEKQLLIQDLCARLPYKVKIQRDNCYDSNRKEIGVLTAEHLADDKKRNIIERLNFKPYLRPMSSMTEEEEQELCNFDDYESISWVDSEEICFKNITISFDLYTRIIDWLNAHHFDYRGLVPKGLAIAVTKENNPYEN